MCLQNRFFYKNCVYGSFKDLKLEEGAVFIEQGLLKILQQKGWVFCFPPLSWIHFVVLRFTVIMFIRKDLFFLLKNGVFRQMMSLFAQYLMRPPHPWRNVHLMPATYTNGPLACLTKHSPAVSFQNLFTQT